MNHAEQTAEMLQLRMLLCYAVLRHGGRLTMTPEDLAETACHRLCEPQLHEDGSITVEVQPRHSEDEA